MALLYALTGSFDALGGNVLFPSMATAPTTGEDLPRPFRGTPSRCTCHAGRSIDPNELMYGDRLFSFPFKLNDTTRMFFLRAAETESPQTAADMRAIVTGHPSRRWRSLACPQTRSTTRSCAPPVLPPSWRADTR